MQKEIYENWLCSERDLKHVGVFWNDKNEQNILKKKKSEQCYRGGGEVTIKVCILGQKSKSEFFKNGQFTSLF